MQLTEAVSMARRLVADHGLEGWAMGLDNAKTRAGACHFAMSTISLSRHLTALHDADEVRDTVLHEIAHALVGPGHGHDAVWRAQARRIGCTGTRCLPVEAPTVAGNWIGTCPRGHVRTQHRRPERPSGCTACARPVRPQDLISWTWRGISVRMHPKYVAELVHLSRTTNAEPVKEQLALDAVLGGGADSPQVAPFLVSPLPVGSVVRIVAPGPYSGVTGVVEALGRTKYRVRVPGGTLRVPPSLLVAAEAPSD